jgi:hypothetical protein
MADVEVGRGLAGTSCWLGVAGVVELCRRESRWEYYLLPEEGSMGAAARVRRRWY